MKFKNMIKLLVLVAFAFVAVSFSTNRASASEKGYYIDTYPKAVRGTWYLKFKNKSAKANDKLVIGKKKMTYYDNINYVKQTLTIHDIHEKHVHIKKGGYVLPVYAAFFSEDGYKGFCVQPWGTKKSKDPKNVYVYVRKDGHLVLATVETKTRRTVIFTRTLASQRKLAKVQYSKIY